ncbi:hypothetical protein AAVH_37768, partial [Aphelenchoides avenae]
IPRVASETLGGFHFTRVFTMRTAFLLMFVVGMLVIDVNALSVAGGHSAAAFGSGLVAEVKRDKRACLPKSCFGREHGGFGCGSGNCPKWCAMCFG